MPRTRVNPFRVTVAGFVLMLAGAIAAWVAANVRPTQRSAEWIDGVLQVAFMFAGVSLAVGLALILLSASVDYVPVGKADDPS